tara:strand:- start:19313 stop:19477 length:165 start_codon:yes stop_codon:yes gene_type:complete
MSPTLWGVAAQEILGEIKRALLDFLSFHYPDVKVFKRLFEYRGAFFVGLPQAFW